MDNADGIGLFETITLFTTWIDETEWAEAFDASARVALGIDPRHKPEGIVKFLPKVQDELFATVRFLVVEDFICKSKCQGLPLERFIETFREHFGYRALDWIASLPGTELTLYEVVARDDTWLTVQEVLRPIRGTPVINIGVAAQPSRRFNDPLTC